MVGVDFVLRLEDGQVIQASSPEAPLTFVYGQGDVLPGLEEALEGLSPGDRRELLLPPGAALADRDPTSVDEIPRNTFPPDVEIAPGTQLELEGPDGETIPFTVLGVEDDKVIVDLNHPLAGRTLRLEVTVREVRKVDPRPDPAQVS